MMRHVESRTSTDGSVKLLWELPGGEYVESIRFRYGDGEHGCISSQAGCPVACAFCETGRVRRHRNLSVEQIVDQVRGMGTKLRVVQFAGMGEPLLNPENVAQATRTILAKGLAREVTLTTVGIVPAMEALADLPLARLNVSLHAADDATRQRLIPVGRKYPIREVIAAAVRYRERTGNPVTMNYLLLNGVNDSDADIARLAVLLDPAIFSIRLKAWNAIPGTDLRASPPERVRQVLDTLQCAGFAASLCESMGADIGGGCGQLSASRGPAVGSAPLPVTA
ncbi:MAG: 23S rRNA (adenine(2503)-C(2))-methyltransferase RlmN [Sphingomonas sp.]|nr:23S rRNA (adenine(2503)-C(2))-methyltransferase RlmN [Sphingomonas sp.]